MKNAILGVVILSSAALAQSPLELGASIGQSIKNNAANLQRYTHSRSTEIVVHGEVKSTRLDLVRFVRGEMETIPLSQSLQQPEPGGIRGRIIEKKKEEIREYVDRLISLSRRYLTPGAGDISDVLQKASFSLLGQPPAQVRITIAGYVKPSDSFTMTIDLATRTPVQTLARTDLDGGPVDITVDYSRLPDGTPYPSQARISSLRRDIRVSIDSFDYELVGVP